MYYIHWKFIDLEFEIEKNESSTLIHLSVSLILDEQNTISFIKKKKKLFIDDNKNEILRGWTLIKIYDFFLLSIE